MTNMNSLSQNEYYEKLNSLTLKQKELCRQHRLAELSACEESIKECIYSLFGDEADEYYAVHLFDFTQYAILNDDLKYAEELLNTASALIRNKYGECRYLSFMYSFLQAHIDFKLEEYYSCIEHCVTVNTNWYDANGEYAKPPFIPASDSAQSSIDLLGYQNIILLCNAYGSIGDAATGIDILSDCYDDFPQNADIITSRDIALAQLYIRNGSPDKAAPIYEKYRQSNLLDYPDLACAMQSIAFSLKGSSDNIPILLPNISSDGLITLQYNYALSLVQNHEYDAALDIFKGLSDKGLSMVLALLCKLDRMTEAPSYLVKATEYYSHQVDTIRLHYSEQTAYKHMSGLKYHIDFILGAYCRCAIDSIVHASEAFEFLLNSKHISLDVADLIDSEADTSVTITRYRASDIMKLLDSKTAILEFAKYRTIDESRYGVFVISDNHVDYVDLCSCEDMDKNIRLWLSSVRMSSNRTFSTKEEGICTADMNSANTFLRRTVYMKIKSILSDITNLYIATDGMLGLFPVENLSVSAGEILSDRYSINYINAAKELLLDANMAVTSDALLVGAPAYINYPSLPGAEDELNVVASYMSDGYLFTGREANVENFVSALYEDDNLSPNIIHFAAHGITFGMDSDDISWESLYDSLNSSGIVLADDALLSCKDISTLNLKGTALTTLSCCNLAKGISSSMDGIFGMRRSLKLAGCKCILANLWEADDYATVILMDAFYHELIDNKKAPSQALRLAKEHMKQYEINGCTPYSSPFYWAGYIIIGDRFIT